MQIDGRLLAMFCDRNSFFVRELRFLWHDPIRSITK